MEQHQSQSQSTSHARQSLRTIPPCEIIIKFASKSNMNIGPFQNKEHAAIVLSGFVQNSIMKDVKEILIKDITDNRPKA
jgi:hypothetical protein